jgi:hypothetical protein
MSSERGVTQWSYRIATTRQQKKAVAYYNEVDDVDDYFVNYVSIEASTDSNEGDVLIM